MITVYSQRKVIGTDRYDYDLKGLSTDEKPSEIYGIKIVENSIFFEVDTGDFYYLKSQTTESKTVLFEEQSFVGVYQSGTHSYNYPFDADPFDNDNICVKFDGIKYECSRSGDPGFNMYGAPWDYTTRTFDWSTYPFLIEADTGDPEDHVISVDVADGNEHTIEIYTESSTPAVWEKIGGGSSGGSSVVGTAVVGTAVVGG